MFTFVFSCKIKKFYLLYLLSISLSHTSKAFFACGYILIPSKVCNLLPLLLLSAILLASSVYTQRTSLLNLYFNFSMVSFINKQFL